MHRNTIALAPHRRPSSKQAAGDRLERHATSAQLGGNEGRQRTLGTQPGDRLGWKASLAIDHVRVGSGELLGDANRWR